MNENFIGERVIVRGEASGVFYGTFKERWQGDMSYQLS